MVAKAEICDFFASPAQICDLMRPTLKYATLCAAMNHDTAQTTVTDSRINASSSSMVKHKAEATELQKELVKQKHCMKELSYSRAKRAEIFYFAQIFRRISSISTGLQQNIGRNIGDMEDIGGFPKI